jgi:hypothetical protein
MPAPVIGRMAGGEGVKSGGLVSGEEVIRRGSLNSSFSQAIFCVY